VDLFAYLLNLSFIIFLAKNELLKKRFLNSKYKNVIFLKKNKNYPVIFDKINRYFAEFFFINAFQTFCK